MAEPSSLILVACSLRYVVPSFCIWTTGSSCAVSLTYRVFGTSTCKPYSITCAVNMKIMSSTRTTSTNGVTLISARGAPPRLPRRDPKPPPFTEKDMLFSETALGHVEEFEGEIVHARANLADAAAEGVVRDGGGNGGEKTERGGIERFRDARSNGAQAGGALGAQRVEGSNDAHHGTQQADERRNGRHRGQHAHAVFEPRELFADAELQGSLNRR